MFAYTVGVIAVIALFVAMAGGSTPMVFMIVTIVLLIVAVLYIRSIILGITGKIVEIIQHGTSLYMHGHLENATITSYTAIDRDYVWPLDLHNNISSLHRYMIGGTKIYITQISGTVQVKYDVGISFRGGNTQLVISCKTENEALFVSKLVTYQLELLINHTRASVIHQFDLGSQLLGASLPPPRSL